VGEDTIKRVLRRNLETALRRRDVVEARGILARLKEIDPVSLEARALELELLLEEDRLAEAESLSRQLCELHSGSPRVHLLAGRLAYKQKRHAEAAAHFEEGHRLHPSWVLARWWGKSLTQLGRLDEAEAVLLPLAESHAAVLGDLAWLYERRGDVARAVRYVERHLEHHPSDRLAQAQRRRLRAREASPEELEEEVQSLSELGEPVAAELLGEHVDALFAQGRSAEARRRIEERLAGGLAPHEAGRLGWICYGRQAYDLAYPLFAQAAPHNLRDHKLLSSLETAARRAGRVDDLVALYEGLASQDRRFHGRVRRLRRRGDSSGPLS